MKHSQKWFTLVELVVVAVILSILATVGFISYEKYLVDTRDSKRLAQLTWLRDWLRLATTKGQLPMPDDNVEIRISGESFLYQWYAGENLLESIWYSETTKDPYDDTYYTYLLSNNKRDFQLLGFLEEYNPGLLSSTSTLTHALDYTARFPKLVGKKLWILLEQGTNTPLQEISEYSASWYLDLNDTTTNEFDAYITDTDVISWNQSDLLWIIPYTTCDKIKQLWEAAGNRMYYINPEGTTPFKAYCNMDTAGGWWTLVARTIVWAAWNQNNFGWNLSIWDASDDTQPYSMWSASLKIPFKEVLLTWYNDGKNIDHFAAHMPSTRNQLLESISYTPVVECTTFSDTGELSYNHTWDSEEICDVMHRLWTVDNYGLQYNHNYLYPGWIRTWGDNLSLDGEKPQAMLFVR